MMKRWEYCAYELKNFSIPSIVAAFNAFGKDGWEVFHILEAVNKRTQEPVWICFMRREIMEEHPSVDLLFGRPLTDYTPEQLAAQFDRMGLNA